MKNWLDYFRRRAKLNEVFTPFTTPTHTYVNRTTIEQAIRNYITMPGVQLVVYGPTGSGKTTVIRQTLRQMEFQSIVTTCTESATIDGLVKDAFRKLPARFTKSRRELRWARVAAALDSVEKHNNKRLPLHITPQRLAEIVGNANIVWVIEQFHLVAEPERVRMLEILKVFSDLSWIYGNPKIIIVGNCHTALELFYYQTSMSNRIGEVEVPYMDRGELLSIVRQGELALQVSLSDEMRTKLVRHSHSLPGVCQQLALILCLQNNIRRQKKQGHEIPAHGIKDLLTIYLRYYRNAFGTAFFKAMELPATHNIPAILELISKAGNDGISLDSIRQSESCRKMTYAQLHYDLAILSGPECNHLLSLDRCLALYVYSNPYVAAYAAMYFSRAGNNQKNVILLPVDDKRLEKVYKRLNTLQPAI